MHFVLTEYMHLYVRQADYLDGPKSCVSLYMLAVSVPYS